jgi:hypothetical protein
MASTTFSGPVTSTNGFIGSITGAVSATTISATGDITVDSATAPVAGGASAVLMTSTAGLGIYVGSGVPTVSAAKGSLYLRTDGTTTNDRAYINTNGSTTWTALTTVA